MRPSEKEKRLQRYNFILQEWAHNLVSQRYISNYLIDKGYTRIGIYGYSDLGELLYEELDKCGLTVQYIVDRNCNELENDNVKMILPNEMEQFQEDVVIVTAILDYSVLKNKYSMKKMISLEQIIYEMGVKK